MSVSATYNLQLDVIETLSLGLDLADDPNIPHKISGSSGTLNATSTPPATKVSSDERTLTAGADTIDLTAAPGPTVNGSATTVDMTGLKVQAVKIKADAGNTAAIVVKKGATNGYNIMGDATGQITLAAGDEVLLKLNDSLPDVSGTAKTIDVTSGDADAKYKILLLAG